MLLKDRSVAELQQHQLLLLLLLLIYVHLLFTILPTPTTTIPYIHVHLLFPATKREGLLLFLPLLPGLR